MITKFDSSYVGSVDLENAGYLGTPINDRRYSNEELAEVLHKAVAYAKQMDGLGYDTFWMAEHHFQPEGTECIPNLLMMAMHLCGVTKHLRIGCGFNVVPMWHPLRLAEDYAMADMLTGGRVIFGVGARLSHARGRELRRAAHRPGRQPRAVRGRRRHHLQGLQRGTLLPQGQVLHVPPEVPYRGYTLKDITLVPRPLRLPVECWQPIQSGSDRAFDFMAKHGICGVIGGGSAEGGAVDRHMTAFHAAYARRGIELELGERLSLGYQFFIAESREAAMRKAGKVLRREHEDVRRAAPGARDHRRADRRDARSAAGAQHQAAAHRGRGEGRRLPGRHAGRHHRAAQGGREALSGPRARQLQHAAGHAARRALEQLDRFANEVMPAFRTVQAAAAE